MKAKQKLKDKNWRINNLYKIVDKKSQSITFKSNSAQADFDNNKHTRNLILKSRQLGFTTLESIDSLDDVLWKPNFKALFISYDKDSAIEIFDDKIKYAWDNYDPFLKGLYKLDSDRANKLKFDFGDNAFSSIIVRNKGRSGTFNRVHVSEFAKICAQSPQKAKEIVTGTIPAVPDDGRCDIESTAEGATGTFYEMFWEAFNRDREPLNTEFKAHFYNWTWEREEINALEAITIDQFDEKEKFIEYKEKLKRIDDIDLSDKELTFYYKKWLSLNKNWLALNQEFPTTPEEAFVFSGNVFFDSGKVEELKKYRQEAKIEGDWKIYEEYNPLHNYILGSDVSHGIGKDHSTVVIIDFTPLQPKVVAIYKNNTIDASTFAHIIKDGGNRYGSCLAIVENNDRGYATLDRLKDNYSNIYQRERKIDGKETKELGFNTNSATKPKIMTDLKIAVNEDLIDIPCKHICSELRSYDDNDVSNTRFDEDQTNHWDLVIALALAWFGKDKVISQNFEIITKDTTNDIFY